MNVSLGLTEIGTTINNTSILGVTWIVSLIIIFFTLLLISRRPSDWKILALPVSLAWYLSGIRTSIIFVIITALIFVIESMSTDVIGEMLQTQQTEEEKLERKEIIRSMRKRIRTGTKYEDTTELEKRIKKPIFKVDRPIISVPEIIRRLRKK